MLAFRHNLKKKNPVHLTNCTKKYNLFMLPAVSIIDLFYIRDHSSMSNLTKLDVQFMIDFLCLNE